MDKEVAVAAVAADEAAVAVDEAAVAVDDRRPLLRLRLLRLRRLRWLLLRRRRWLQLLRRLRRPLTPPPRPWRTLPPLLPSW